MNLRYLSDKKGLRITLLATGILMWVIVTQHGHLTFAVAMAIEAPVILVGVVVAAKLAFAMDRTELLYVAISFFLPYLNPLLALLPPAYGFAPRQSRFAASPASFSSPRNALRLHYDDPAPAATMEFGDVRCAVCDRVFTASLALLDPNEVKVASCRVCPANRVYAICSRCADLERVTSGSCPQCGAAHMWQNAGKVPK